jgi:peptidyl-dipeptidase Dcp
MKTTNINPLLQSFELKDQAIPFHLIKTEHYIPALEAAIKQAKFDCVKIKSEKNSTFENTMVALENLTESVDRISGIYFNLFSAEASAAHQALAKDISPLLSAFASDITLDSDLFSRVKLVYESRKQLNLVGEDLRLVEKKYLDFVRNGALLDPAKKERLRQLDQELSVLGPQFSENVLNATNAFELWVDKKEDLLGLPDHSIEAAAIAAQQKLKSIGQPADSQKWLFTLHGPSLIPFLTYADSSPLRETIWRASSSKAFGGTFDNKNIVMKIINLKFERANLLGFKNYADYVLQERMAQTSTTVFNFLEKLLEPSKKAAQKDLEEIRSFRQSIDGNTEIKPWDFAYYSEKLKEQKYSFNEEELRPYFKLENVIDGVFKHAEKLFKLNFKPTSGVPTYHPDVKTFEVFEKTPSGENYMGLFYMDFFPRETKKGGAWMTNFREQGLWGTNICRPHVSIVCNFTKPTPTKPSLLSYEEVLTLFHEFGHALHGLLSKCKYRSLAGTNVYWDFVELPSQIMENWVKEKEGLDLFAQHYENGEKIPAELVAKIKTSLKFQVGWQSLRQLNFGLLDMNWYSTDPKNINDVDEFETSISQRTRLLPKEPGTNSSCSFGHIFGGGYAAGYYSYKWAEVLDADAFEYFKEKGLFNEDVATKFKNSILSKGGTAHPMELYKEFRGREPDPNSLLRRDGLL